MRSLPDVNVLVALAWPNHIHHSAAVTWFLSNGMPAWATCPLTQLGFIRLSSNPRAIAGAVAPAAAAAHLALLQQRGGHQFWPADLDAADVPLALAAGHQQLTDAYLLAMAVRHGGVLVTFDRPVRDLMPTGGAAEANLLVLNGGGSVQPRM